MLANTKLQEHVSVLDRDLDFLATSSTADVKNIIANSKDLLRIIYFFDSGYYYIARNTYKETHFSLLNYLYFNKIEDWKVFYVDESKQPYDADCVFIVSTPKDKLQTNLNGESFNIITDDDYNYGYEYENHLILVRRKHEADFCPLFDNAKIKLYEEFKDEVSEDTLKKRRKYYLTHGITTSGLLESAELDVTTPYMLRNDGELLKCGDYHPYIKSYRNESLEETKKYLSLHKNFLKWFYDNTLNEEVKNIISNLKFTQEEIDRLWYLTNQEFCRVRTSNYRYKTGGDNGEIYFRISSENFNWFELIWNVCVKFIHSIDYVTIMKDPQTFGKQFDYIKIKDTKINKLPIKNFIELEGEPLVESQVTERELKELKYYIRDKHMDRNLFLKLKAALSEVAEEERKNAFKNKGTIFSNSGFRMHTKSALAYLDNLYKLENIFKNNGNKEALQDVEKEIQSLETHLKNKKSFALESFNDELEEDIEKHEELNPLLFENDELKSEIKEAIEKIVNQFVEDLKTDGVKIEVKDVILVGSNVSYNYTKDSDLDIHIIVDKDKLDCDPELYTLLYGVYRSLFNKNYDITLKGIPVEIYVELV